MRLGIIGVALLGLSCGKSAPEILGIGAYKIGVSTPADGYVCRPDDGLIYCSNNPSPVIAGHKTDTSLYFRGPEPASEDNSLLVEILVGVQNCRSKLVVDDLHVKLGKPTQLSNERVLWTLQKVTVIALFPRNDNMCTLHFLDPQETERIASLYPDTNSAPADSPTQK